MVLAGKTSGEAAQAQLIVLDAKYRIDTALNDAISSIHTYRDALVENAGGGEFHGIVQAAYLLTPHIPQLDAATYQTTAMPGRLFHPDYRSTFRFGAATLKPGMNLPDICAALRAIIADAAGTPVSP
ncbi:MAG: nuclease domain-containing protein [Paracoccus sp. (in: a-proteobacteria)]|uniref:nuclease domain-containing protein n=1 Tax=Paracoccus sp. TaxID=267 RepID=UPI0040599873